MFAKIPGRCLDSGCHPNATCKEFGGYQQCTCKLGFAGDGSYCYDINECDDYYLNYCDYGYCVNTVGSYTCVCYNGFTNIKNGCVDIDECSGVNNCSPYAVCTNYYGSYSCSCPYGYIGNGTYCEINECEKGTPCGLNSDCKKVIGSYSCIDPCSIYTTLNDPWRSTDNRFEHYAEVQAYSNSYYYVYYWDGQSWYSNYSYLNNYYLFYLDYYNNFVHCDYNLQGWYRFKGENNVQMFDHPVAENSCGTQYPMTLNGSHPNVGDGIVNRTACPYRDNYDCWWTPTNVSIKACPGGFYVYKLSGTPGCYFAYCTTFFRLIIQYIQSDSISNCSSLNCASDEECRNTSGVPKCYCKNTTLANNTVLSSSQTSLLTPTLTCDLYQIKVSYSKCLLERMGFNSSNIHLIDNNCTNFIERNNQSFATVITLPKSGYCGGQLLVNDTHITYVNTIYIERTSGGAIVRDPFAVNFYCSFLKNMQTSLSTGISPFASVGQFTVGATITYLVKMGLFTNFNFSTQYQGAQLSLDSKSMLYVGLIVEDAKDTNFLLVLRNCYGTPTAVSSDSVKYDIIKDSCPNVNDPTITVHENGVSNQGRFSVQIFKFIGNFPQIYLHCQVTLCDKTLGTCNPVGTHSNEKGLISSDPMVSPLSRYCV
ncbi:hypothetical protein GDO86_017418 [Hymenochirus boettgeri]|uniref:Uromodulin n=1 Tax=Hymenochirus boettgeri TaxID=247094 RepID=A0A8T2IK01_9PIPI|nr:hypothetical protein GDO86_017418 [Hymenochirus boettgeri]